MIIDFLKDMKKVLMMEEIKDFNDYKKYYINKIELEKFETASYLTSEYSLCDYLILSKIKRNNIKNFNQFKKADENFKHCFFIDFINLILNLKEIDNFESFKKFFKNDLELIEEKISEKFNNKFKSEFFENLDIKLNDKGCLVINKIVEQEYETINKYFGVDIKDKKCKLNSKGVYNYFLELETIINIDLVNGFKITGVNYNYYKEFYKIDNELLFELNSKFDLIYFDFGEKGNKYIHYKIINIFKDFLKEKFFPTEKEIKKYILKYRK